MSQGQDPIASRRAVLAIHPGDQYIRAAWRDAPNAAARLEDRDESQRFTTPSLIALGPSDAALGVDAQWCLRHSAAARPWRFQRAGLAGSGALARDAEGRGLSSAAFAALAARRLALDASAWLKSDPVVALVVPDTLSANERRELVALVSETSGLPASLVDEDEALARQLPEGVFTVPTLIVSLDDDALRLRVRGPSGLSLTEEDGSLGMGAIRQSCMERWNGEVQAAAPGFALFETNDCPDFESIWQDLWQFLEAEPSFAPKLGRWSVVRNSHLYPLALTPSGARDWVRDVASRVHARMDSFLKRLAAQGTSVAQLVWVGPKGITRELQSLLVATMPLMAGMQRHLLDPSAYALGAANGAAFRPQADAWQISQAPYALGALGASRDDKGVVFKTLIGAGTALPAQTSITLVVNRDSQRYLAVKLARSGGDGAEPDVIQMTEFGPLKGQGPLKAQVDIRWEASGEVHVQAKDLDSDIALPLLDTCAVRAGVKLVGARHLLALD